YQIWKLLRVHRRFFRYGIAMCLAVAFSWRPIYAADNKEYLVKAAFIYNFVKFVEWPGEKNISKQSNINICVMGNSPMIETGAVFKQASTSQLSLSLISVGSVDSAVAK